MLRIDHLYKSFGERAVLSDVSLEVGNGEIVTLIGPSGTGKTTLLRCTNFLERAESGTVTIDNVTADCRRASRKVITEICRKSGMVFQSYNLFRNRTVLENVMEGLLVVRKLPRSEAEDIAEQELEKVGMLGYEKQYPNQLSGGQQQRVAIARAIAMSPSILLLDEPTSALDPELTHEVLETIRTVANDGIAMLIVTHEIEFARRLSHRIVFMDGGGIVEEGTPRQIFTEPREERTRQFLRQLVPGEFQYSI